MEAPRTLSFLDTGWSGTTASFDATTGARQNGQRWTAPHPQPWNVAGVDYPVGYDSAAIAAQGGWKDPAKNTAALAALGCSYSATGNSDATHYPNLSSGKIQCSRAGSLDFEGWDLKDASGGCIQLQINNTVGGAGATVTIKNNLFGQPVLGSSPPPCFLGNLWFINILGCAGGSDTHYLITQNTLDMRGQEYPYGGGPPNRTNLTGAINMNCPTSTSEVVTYNAFLEGPQKQLQAHNLEPNAIIEAYNYVRNMAEDQTGHGEFFFHGDNPGETAGTADKFYFNTILYGNGDAGSNDATYWCTRGAGSSPVPINLCDMENNTIVANSNPYVSPGSASTVAKLFMENGLTPATNVKIMNNYFDIGAINTVPGAFRFGALNCGVAGIITNLSVFGNVSLQTGLVNPNVFGVVGLSAGQCN